MTATEAGALLIKLAIAGAVLVLVNRLIDPLFSGGFFAGS